MDQPIKSLELRYPMIQFLIIKYIRKLEKNPRKPDYDYSIEAVTGIWLRAHTIKR